MCRKYSVFVHEGVGGVGLFIWSHEQCEWTILWNNFFCAPSLKPWSPPLFFCPFFAPLQSGPNLNPGPLFPPLVQSPHQATTPSVSGGEWGQRGEGGGAKRGASMPGQGATRSNYSKSYPYHTILHLTFSNNTNRRHKMLVVPCHAAILSVSGDGATAAAIPRQLTHNSSIRQ